MTNYKLYDKDNDVWKYFKHIKGQFYYRFLQRKDNFSIYQTEIDGITDNMIEISDTECLEKFTEMMKFFQKIFEK